MIIQADSNGLSANASHISLKNPVQFLAGTTTQCIASLTNKPIGTMMHDSDIGQLVYSDNSNIKIVHTPCTVTLWDTVTVYSSNAPQWVRLSVKNPSTGLHEYTAGSFRKYGRWPDASEVTPGTVQQPWPTSSYNALIYDDFYAAHDGHITHVDFGATFQHIKSNVPIFEIERPNNTLGQKSKLTLQLTTTSTANVTTTYDIGDILQGPSANLNNNAVSTDTNRDVRWRFDIKPSINYVSFKKNDSSS